MLTGKLPNRESLTRHMLDEDEFGLSLKTFCQHTYHSLDQAHLLNKLFCLVSYPNEDGACPCQPSCTCPEFMKDLNCGHTKAAEYLNGNDNSEQAKEQWSVLDTHFKKPHRVRKRAGTFDEEPLPSTIRHGMGERPSKKRHRQRDEGGDVAEPEGIDACSPPPKRPRIVIKGLRE
ncbi:hypothetical protein FOL47_002287 [Perkinsus chesapeaki]|uniref:SWIM-type domain-containing protein n=1 Tax=Perkinsus chesapeaki TaxID=330153 RepID=A0A7J6KR10_PERCH|nr:hypothetical protein FOL47_002287 [Perkinsus chesapeaki]